MIIGVPKETFPDERRVALVPTLVPALVKKGFEIWVEAGAGTEAGFPDESYQEKGAHVVSQRVELFGKADVILQVRGLGANPKQGHQDLKMMKPDQVIIGFLEPLGEPQAIRKLAAQEVIAFALELLPRITRAQSMDVLSSMATIAGYKAVLLAAETLPKMFPMMITAAGTISPARLYVVGAGVAGLQAIATARKLGAVVSAYDIRPAVKEEVESLGAKFVELALEDKDVATSGGYAKSMDESFYRRQRELMAKVVAESDVVITTAAVPGKKAPILITGEMVKKMSPGSVIVDLAAERGGNCELSRPGEIAVEGGVTILAPINITSTIPYHASQMYAKNISNFLQHITADGKLKLDEEDEIMRETRVTQNGEILHPQVRELAERTS
ncbi:Re/Si-specific NAD(P)(+) transhydrogenase subunit alpha [Candidatus Acetothermia bacterium]|jgi:NAD(P) transhydrogenase subunit alpha|nr:Re/Si-specific NAD(P)(+) transhydrogenase subunit alpha [Candidatus Acetothermia bacterium]MCI2427811.1 Re/Si-specific NAD(P)(+) transhydrogenase subunit alpha [Candidatus Acetothermia bacterium]MCI2428329.1 Re/Si-specific NAD(P)(+) transhydrogenase subunit alpha [Candidatus Acetothermia bacterium]